MSSYLRSLPCGPNKTIYEIVIINYSNTYKVLTNLDNKKDKDIPVGWYEVGNYPGFSQERKEEVNYGVSSTNILWYEQDFDPSCGLDCIKCLGLDQENCEGIINGTCVSGFGIQCYTGDPKTGCARSSCCSGSGCP
jgi:hypothetical protein